MHSLAFMEGLGTGASLIIAIGAQNAFVLKQGLLRNHVFITALFCALSDALLITLGVMGLGDFLTSNELLLTISKWGGALFLFYYGARSFRAVWHRHTLEISHEGPARPGLKKTLYLLAALTFLNPHVYIDAIVLLGTIGAQFPEDDRLFFLSGTILASFLWFFGVSYGARFLTPFFARPLSWKMLDCLIGLVMWAIAFALVVPSFSPIHIGSADHRSAA